MTLALLTIFHPGVDDPESAREPGHSLAHRILADLHRLRSSLVHYQQYLELDSRGTDFPF